MTESTVKNNVSGGRIQNSLVITFIKIEDEFDPIKTTAVIEALKVKGDI